jgi:bacteriorhodopsin
MERKGRFWLWVIGVALAVGIGGFLVFALIGWAWYAWGFFGMLLFFAVVLLGFAWVYDKRQQRPYEP